MYLILFKENNLYDVTTVKASHIIEAAQFFCKNFPHVEVLQITLAN